MAPSDAEVNELLNTATVFVQTSRHEGFCLPVLEAMATGIPVVCTDAHGNRDFCRDGENCLMPAAEPDGGGGGHRAGARRIRRCARGCPRRGSRPPRRTTGAAGSGELEAFFERVAGSARGRRGLMRVAFLVAELGRSGGMGVIRDWARALDDAVLVVCGDARGAQPAARRTAHPCGRCGDGGEPVDVAVATWWTTADALWDLPGAAARRARCRASTQRYYRDDEPADRLGAAAVLDLPVGLRRGLAAPGARGGGARRRARRVRVVAPGIDKAVFAPAPPRPGGGPLRVLVEGQPSDVVQGRRRGAWRRCGGCARRPR